MKFTSRLAATAVALTVGLTTVSATVAAASTSPDAGTAPSAAARAAGITQDGGAFMGWSLHHDAKAGAAAQAAPMVATATQTKGIDVSHYQGTVNWTTQWNNGNRFAYIKATEGTTYTDSQFSANYTGSYTKGFVRGSYHFARPDVSTGATQATYFIAHGGGWSRDGKTLPGALDIEYNPYGATCYGKSQASMVTWIKDFVNTYHAKTSRYPVIYTTFDWWNTCTGNSSALSANSPFWIARYNTTVGSIPAGASTYTIWQWTSSPLDQNRFNGALDRVVALANG